MDVLRTGFGILLIAVVLALFGNVLCSAPAASQVQLAGTASFHE